MMANTDNPQSKPPPKIGNWYNKSTLITSIVAIVVSVFAAMFAWKQLNVAKDTAQKQLRAYVYAVAGGIFNLDGSNGTQGYVRIKNGGQTFAKSVSRSVGINVLGQDIPDRFDDLGDLVPEDGTMTLGPNTETDDTIYRTYGVIDEDEIKAIKSGDKRIYVFGKITYEDIYFLPHKTTFCFMYYGSETSPNWQGYVSSQAEYCDKHNIAD